MDGHSLTVEGCTLTATPGVWVVEIVVFDPYHETKWAECKLVVVGLGWSGGAVDIVDLVNAFGDVSGLHTLDDDEELSP